jgi:hypothetical protein
MSNSGALWVLLVIENISPLLTVQVGLIQLAKVFVKSGVPLPVTPLSMSVLQ